MRTSEHTSSLAEAWMLYLALHFWMALNSSVPHRSSTWPDTCAALSLSVHGDGPEQGLQIRMGSGSSQACQCLLHTPG